MTANAQWMRLTECSTGLDADILRATLEAENIPVQLKSNQAGIFGAAFQGAVVGGIEVLVPSPMLQRAQIILSESSSESSTDDLVVDEDDSQYE